MEMLRYPIIALVIGWILGDKFTPDGKIKDFLAQKFGVNHFSAPCAQ